jgi:hypothetical protein
MLQFAPRKALALTSEVKDVSLAIMKRTAPTFYGLSAGQMTDIAKKAVANAVAANARAGIPVTGFVDGRVQTLQASDPRIAKFLKEHSNVRAS